MKKIFKRAIAGVMAILVLLTCAACSKDEGTTDGQTKTVTIMYTGTVVQMERYKLLIDTFNETVGKEKGINVVAQPKVGSLELLMPNLLPSNGTPDLVILEDRYLKLYNQYYQDITSYVGQDIIDDLYPNCINRCRFNPETTTSNPEDPLYALPMFNDPTVLYYNKEAVEKNGIICISVAEEDLDAFNAGTLADGYGKTKADYGITVDVPAKGFYRSVNPYVPMEGELDGYSWVAPEEGEVLIFNDRIAMNWDELDDISMVCTKKWNPNSCTQYGFYTEWWFNYGWSIGADCTVDLSGKGDWTYSLAADNPNYIVNEGKTYTGIYTGKTYQAGETLDTKDILVAQAGDVLDVNSEGNTTFYYTVNGEQAEYRDFTAELENGTLDEMPSIRDTMKRFYSISGVGGKEVAPYPSVFSSSNTVQFFGSEKLAFVIERSFSTYVLDNSAVAGKYKVAMMPQYKVYTDPTDPNCDEVETLGKVASHSFSYNTIMSAKSSAKDEAAVFMTWAASEGQKVLAENGHVSSRYSDQDLMREKYSYVNPEVLLLSIEAAKPGDWWYMKDAFWIDIWAVPLNNQVRNGTMTFEQWVFQYIDRTNEYLKKYKEN